MTAHYDAEKVKQAISRERFGDLLEHFGAKVNRRSGHATCAAHGGDNPQALHYSEKGGTVLWNCFTQDHGGDVLSFIMEREGLDFPSSVEWLGDWLGFAPEPSHPRSRPTMVKTTRYDIRDSSGILVATHIRRDPPGADKTFLWERDGKPGLSGLKAEELPLYGSERLSTAPLDALVFLTEGEKAADALRQHGFHAVASVTGASGTPGEAAFAVLRGRQVVLWPDHDDPGQKHMGRIGKALQGVAQTIQVLNWGESKGDDAADFFQRGGGGDELLALASKLPEWKAPSHYADESGLSAVTVRLSDVVPESVSWLWPGRVPFGKLTIIEGNPGLGKSLLTLDLAARLSQGREFPDGTRPEAADVVILSAEDGLADTIRPRLEAAGADLSRVHALTAVRLPDGAEVMPTIAANVMQIKAGVLRTGARLVIIDPLMAFLGSKTDSYKDQDIRRVLAPLHQMAADTGAAVVLVRHLRKSSDGGAINAGGGSIGIIGAARSGLLIACHPTDPELRLVAPVKANLSLMAPTLAFRIAEKQIGPISAPFIAWEQEPLLDLTADDLIAAQRASNDHRRSALEEAKDFLRESLADGPVSEASLRGKAEGRGISKITLTRAKAALSVESVRSGFGQGRWDWKLTSHEEDHPQLRGSFPETDRLRDGLITFDDESPSQPAGALIDAAKDCPRFEGTDLSGPCAACDGRYADHRFDWRSSKAAEGAVPAFVKVIGEEAEL